MEVQGDGTMDAQLPPIGHRMSQVYTHMLPRTPQELSREILAIYLKHGDMVATDEAFTQMELDILKTRTEVKQAFHQAINRKLLEHIRKQWPGEKTQGVSVELARSWLKKDIGNHDDVASLVEQLLHQPWSKEMKDSLVRDCLKHLGMTLIMDPRTVAGGLRSTCMHALLNQELATLRAQVLPKKPGSQGLTRRRGKAGSRTLQDGTPTNSSSPASATTPTTPASPASQHPGKPAQGLVTPRVTRGPSKKGISPMFHGKPVPTKGDTTGYGSSCNYCGLVLVQPLAQP